MVNATTVTATRFYTACIIAETTEVAMHLQMPQAKPPDFAMISQPGPQAQHRNATPKCCVPPEN